MSQQQQERTEKIGEAVNGWEQLAARQQTIHTWTVISWRNGTQTAHEVDTRERTCTCEDMQFNLEGSEVCDHLMKALYVQSARMEVGDALSHELTQQLMELDKHVRALERKATGIAADEQADGSADGSESTEPPQESFDGDPAEEFRSLLIDAGLDPDKFTFWVDEEFGSLQIEQDGYLSDDGFDLWVELSDDLDLGYDGDDDVNYLQADRFSEVFA